MKRKTWDFHLRVPAELVAPLMQLVTERDGVDVIHVGQTPENPAATNGARDPSNEPWARKAAVGVMQHLRALSRESTNATQGVWYMDLGNVCYKENILGSPRSVTAVLSVLHRANKITKLSRGRYLPKD